MFEDRADAGTQLAELLRHESIEADLVLAIPRGALPVARPVADELEAPLDVVIASKIGAPGNQELAIGAVASDGSAWLNDALIEQLAVDPEYVEREREAEAENAREKLARYRGVENIPDVAGKRVVLVDDGIATGATARACLRQLKAAEADQIILAVPVGSPDAIEALQGDADDVVAVESPPHFDAVGQFYERFDQVTDEEAMTFLDEQ